MALGQIKAKHRTAGQAKPKSAKVVGPQGNGAPARVPEIPPLENGDRLTRWEFERRYEALPHVKKAELIEGVVYMPSPARMGHAVPHSSIMMWLTVYAAHTPGLTVADNGTLRLDADNEVQPDAMLLSPPQSGGRARVSDDDFAEGAPELVVEVALSSASYDRHIKKNVYRRTGVQEYVIWVVRDARVEWYVLEEGEYLPLPPDPDGITRSRVFPGLYLDAQALLAGDGAKVLAVLQEGLASEAHAEFVKRLSSASAAP